MGILMSVRMLWKNGIGCGIKINNLLVIFIKIIK